MKRLLITIFGLHCLSVSALAGARVMQGFVPDWQQPPAEGAGAGNWSAWCVPTSAANLIGYWEDERGEPIADGFVFPSTDPGGFGVPAWKDYLADPGRPAPGAPAPVTPTDLGWFLNTNNNGDQGVPGGNNAHAGTFLEDIDAGLSNFLNLQQPSQWTTGTRGKSFASGFDPSGNLATIHQNAVSAFAEIQHEIDRNRPVLITWAHWQLLSTGNTLSAVTGSGNELEHGGTFFDFDPAVAPFPFTDPDFETNEVWNGLDGQGNLGHTVTAVGYIPAGDLDDPTGNTDWIIVHDNVSSPRNVIVPLDFSVWRANTTAVPEPGVSLVIVLGLGAWGSRRKPWRRVSDRTVVPIPGFSN